mmetsp:Transcript_2252/g.3413  ORF Transcript_2252/g.3413 Transcript_2252/m.3413 type:complete len:167 (-) Transcript_2252:385-885(-)|eukprot:CAMPEP_0197236796 /NCGR_PEP_ID=MMETSP1429-20130617/3800_1 /TAXON_ID=49237 /ORGANISM="Chaetoceros  sp., Strain UNC1202" /LENGTH=166 /DNA_ID=CAMNT_0042695667 /DNA_START=120 /DNA_END=620 /DNA_ORIENTATION=-
MTKNLFLLLTILATATAFAPSSFHNVNTAPLSASTDTEFDDAPRMNPDKPELPEIKGDFDWDEKFAGDDDWIVDNIPGKIALSDLEIAAQGTALSKIEEAFRKERLQQDYDDARILGWTTMSETYNGRFAMFFLSVGLLTEYWTGITIPGQIEEMLRVGGFIGPDY